MLRIKLVYHSTIRMVIKMKKIKYFIVLLGSLLVSACTNTSTSSNVETNLKIMVPRGTPAISQVYVQKNEPSLLGKTNYTIDLVDGADPLVAALSAKTHDIIYAPINLGAKIYASNSTYQFAATVVTGNYYLVTKTNEMFDFASLNGKEIVVFGKNQTSDFIVQYLMSKQTFPQLPTFSYVSSASEAQSALLVDPTKIVLLAEPNISILKTKIQGLKTIDLQVEYQRVSGQSTYPQAGVFVKNTLDSKIVKAYLEEVNKSIQSVNKDPLAAALLCEELKYGFPQAALISAIPYANISFFNVTQSKVMMNYYLSELLAFNPALVGNQLPAESFYYEIV